MRIRMAILALAAMTLAAWTTLARAEEKGSCCKKEGEKPSCCGKNAAGPHTDVPPQGGPHGPDQLRAIIREEVERAMERSHHRFEMARPEFHQRHEKLDRKMGKVGEHAKRFGHEMRKRAEREGRRAPESMERFRAEMEKHMRKFGEELRERLGEARERHPKDMARQSMNMLQGGGEKMHRRVEELEEQNKALLGKLEETQAKIKELESRLEK